MLDAHNRKRVLTIIPVYILLAVLDLIGVILLATCGTISYNLVSGESRPSRVELILQSLWSRNIESAQLLLSFAVVSAVFLMLKTVITSLVNYRVLYWLAKQETSFSTSLFTAIFNAPFSEIRSINLGEVQWAIMVGSSRLMSGVVTPSITVLGDLITVLVMATTIFIATPILFLFVFFLLFVSHRLFTYFVKGRMRNFGLELSTKGSHLNSQIQNSFQASREIKIYGLSGAIENLFSRDRGIVSLLGQKINYLNGLFRYFLEIMILLSAFFVVIFELYLSDTRRAFTTLILFLSVGLRIIPSLQRLQAINFSLQLSLGATQSYFEMRNRFLGLGAEKAESQHFAPTGKAKGPVSIDIEGLSFQPKGSQTPILNQLSLMIDAGELVAVVGESGSGKTSFVDLISSLLTPSSGSVTFKDQNGMEYISNRTLVGYCAQVPYIFNTSVENNLMIANEFTSQKHVTDLMTQLNLSSIESLNSKDELVPLSERLSGGEKQRIGIARALISSRPVMVFDEPTSSLDQMNANSFWNLIQNYRKRHTLIIVTHDMEIARNSDKIIKLDKGKIVYLGNPRDFPYL
jgi:ATP-binding cassette subfamily C protein